MNDKYQIIIDAGHGGIDSGAVGNNLQEKDLTLQISNYIYNRLKELGIQAKMTRTEDEYLPKEKRIQRVLELYNNSPNTILISNHINAGGGEGAEVVYALKNSPTFAELILDNIGEQGQIKRKIYQRRLPENPNKDYYYILRESGNVEPVLIEYGFIDNKNDAAKLKNNVLSYAEGVVKAITEYIGVPYYSSNPSQETYTVQKGDTLYSISRRLNIPINDLKEINNLSSDILSIGQILFLTKKEEPSNDDIIYTVQKGDSLWGIAKKYGLTVPELIEKNNLSNLTIQINQKLLVPNTTKEEDTYIVQKGDTLWSIARKYGIEVNTLKEINNLKNNTLSINQVLRIK